MIKEFDRFINEGVRDQMTGKPIEEVRESIEQLLEEVYTKGDIKTTISFFDKDNKKLLDEYFLMDDIHSFDVFYIKYRDYVMTVMEVKGGDYWTIIYKEKSVDEFKEMLEKTLKKLK